MGQQHAVCVIFIKSSQIILFTDILPYLKYLVHQMLPMAKYKNHMRVDQACSREGHGQQEFDRTRFIARKLWDLKLEIHMIEKEGTQLADAIGRVITLMLHLYSEGTRSLFIYVCTHVYTR